jgi:hypothetical protein
MALQFHGLLDCFAKGWHPTACKVASSASSEFEVAETPFFVHYKVTGPQR